MQMGIIRGLSVPERIRRWEQLMEAAAQMEEDSVRRRHPDYGDREVFLALMVGRYGEELANEVWPDSAGIAP